MDRRTQTGRLPGVRTILEHCKYQKVNVMYCLIFISLLIEITGIIVNKIAPNGSKAMDLVYVGTTGMVYQAVNEA